MSPVKLSVSSLIAPPKGTPIKALQNAKLATYTNSGYKGVFVVNDYLPNSSEHAYQAKLDAQILNFPAAQRCDAWGYQAGAAARAKSIESSKKDYSGMVRRVVER